MRYKEGWAVLACADWFAGTRNRQPLEVVTPSVEEIPSSWPEIDENGRYARRFRCG